jgi:hypothetical protein
MLSKMILSKQMNTLNSMSRIEELPRVLKQLGEESSPGLLDHHGLPLLQLGGDDYHPCRMPRGTARWISSSASGIAPVLPLVLCLEEELQADQLSVGGVYSRNMESSSL